LLREYGAIFVAGKGVEPADRLIFRDEEEVAAFQKRVKIGSVQFDDITIELQAKASDALAKVAEAAGNSGLSITPRAADSGRRSYDDTVRLWHSRVEPALEHWTALERMTIDEASAIRAMSPFEQVPAVLELERKGIFFAKDLSKSIVYSVAPPGTSQHLSMLAFDVAEFNDPRVRKILADNYWYQTVVSDMPHFTYLGFASDELLGRGLKKEVFDEREFWLPDLEN
jgi:LAS superfamily LD-carboxypeptidase LdcB